MKKSLLFIVTGAMLCCASAIKSQTITTVAGNGSGGFIGDGGQATSAEINGAYGTCFDVSGNMYIADALNHRIRKVSTSGIITTIGGTGVAGYSGDGGQATLAKLYRPTDIAIDAAGNLYISDELNLVIRKISTAGIISTYAGTGVSGYAGDGGQATAAQLTRTNTVSIDHLGNIYIGLYQSNVIRKVSTSGIITTIAGNGASGYSGDGGQATAATLNQPCKAVVDNVGNIYISDEFNLVIRKITASTGIITTIAGNGSAGYGGDGGAATAASINYCEYIQLDAADNLYIADKTNNRIRKVNTTGIISTIVGTGAQGYSGDGGPALSATLHGPEGITFDANGNMYFTDWYNNAIRKVTNPCYSNSTGINQVKSVLEEVNIYPNPSTGIFQVSLSGNNEKASIEIYNTLGELVNRQITTSSNCQINAADLANGVYTVLVSQKDKISTAKIIVQK